MNSLNIININKFDIYFECEPINYSSLFELYLPIIGIDSINLYLLFLNEYNFKIKSGVFNNDYVSLMNKLNLNSNNFVYNIHKLESIGLIKTYINHSDPTNLCVVHILQKPLEYGEFVQNHDFYKILKSKLTNEEYTKLKYKFNSILIKSNYQNISKNTSFLYELNDNIDNKLNYEQIYQLILHKTQYNIQINDEIKSKINYYYDQYHFSIDEIVSFIINSVILENNKYTISLNSLIMNIKKIINSYNNTDLAKIAKINRKFEIFTYKSNLNNFNDVLTDYKNIDCENYLLTLIKEDVSIEMQNALNKMRNKYTLPDCIINCLIDYSLFHNSGKLNPNYILSIAKSLNNLSINTLNSAVKYIQCVNSNIKPYMSYYSDDHDNIPNELYEF